MKDKVKSDLSVLIRRRDYLLRKITDKQSNNFPTGYEQAEVSALDHIISLVDNFTMTEKGKNEKPPIYVPTQMPSIEDLISNKEEVQHSERIVLKELIRNQTSKLVVSRERKGYHEFISFQNFNVSNKLNMWTGGIKVSIRLNEINEIISVLKNQENYSIVGSSPFNENKEKPIDK